LPQMLEKRSHSTKSIVMFLSFTNIWGIFVF